MSVLRKKDKGGGMMERLAELKYDITKLDAKIENMQERINKMAFDDKTEVGIKFLASTVSYLKELREYKQLEEQGLLLRLPCKVGSTLYQPIYSSINEYKVIGLCFDIHHNKWMYEVAYETDFEWHKTVCDFNYIGKTVFLTQAEAEQKLKEMECD